MFYQGVRRDQEEPPRPVLRPEPELGRDGRVPGNDPELGDLFFEIIGKLLDGREDLRREHDPGERDRDLRYDRDVEDPLRPAQCQLDDATRLCDRDRFRERPVGPWSPAHAGYLRIFSLPESGRWLARASCPVPVLRLNESLIDWYLLFCFPVSRGPLTLLFWILGIICLSE